MRVKKHCSILNYLRHADADLYELIQDLCITRILFPPRNKSHGVTFLRPDKEMLGVIKKMALGDNPEDAVNALMSLALKDCFLSADDFHEKRDDIPTFLDKKLPYVSKKNNVVTLTDEATLTIDSNFKPRDGAHISVWVISKHLVSSNTESSNRSSKKRSTNKKTGGGDLTGDRAALFTKIIKKHCDGATMENGDPALEVLCSLCDHLKHDDQALKAVQSQLSWDTLGSLAIVLRPFATNNTQYISDSEYKSWVSKNHTPDSNLFYHNMDVVDKYQEHMNAGNAVFDNVKTAIEESRIVVLSKLAKPTVIGLLAKQFESLVEKVTEANTTRGVMLANQQTAFAEAEMRVFSAVLNDNMMSCLDMDAAISFYTKNFTLNKAYIITNKAQLVAASLSFFYSSAYLVARSDAMVYYPNTYMCGDLGSIADETMLINLDRTLKGRITGLRSKYSSRRDEFNKMLEEWKIVQANPSTLANPTTPTTLATPPTTPTTLATPPPP
jgi:hypothetical protein